MEENSSSNGLANAMARSLDMVFTVDAAGNLVRVNESARRTLGHSFGEWVGKPAADILRLEGAYPITSRLLETAPMPGHVLVNGKAVPVSWSAVRDGENGPVFCIAHTDSREQRFRSLFDNNPDMALFQDGEGIILDANRSFLSFMGKGLGEVLGTPLADFLSPPAAALFTDNLKKAFSGQKVDFETEVDFDVQGPRALSVVKVPLREEGQVVGVHALIRDVTAQREAQRKAQQMAEKLSTIFESITDAFFTLDRDWRLTYINREFDRLLGTDRREISGKSIWEVFPEEVDGLFHQQYHHAAQTGVAVHFEAYHQPLGLWLEVKAFPSEEGLAVYFGDITEQVHQRKELEKLSLVASKTTNSVIITDAQGFTEWVNEGFTRLTGFTLSEAKGRKPGALLQGPETDPETVERVSRLLKTGKPFTDEILNYKKSGEKFWVLKEITPILDESGKITRFIAVQNDVTERKRKEEELRMLSLVASKASNSVIIMDAQGHAEWVNEGFTAMTGYPQAEIIGKNLRGILAGSDTDLAELEKVSEKLAEGVPFNSNLISHRKSGEPFWLAMDVSPVYGTAGNITHFVAIQKDITFRKEAEANLVKMSQTLYRQNKDLGQFTYIVSHNMRAPVANIMGLADLMARVDSNSELYGEAFLKLRESAHRMDTVLGDLNTILSVRDGQGNLKREEVDAQLIVQQALTSLQAQLEGCGGTVRVEMREGLRLWANKAYLYSIFQNLLSNAIKYRSGERPLRVRIKFLGDPRGGVAITFSDNGLGFDMKRARGKVFGLYQRFHTGIEGRGIGLYLVKAHLEAMGGEIEVTSAVGVGTDFLMYLPKAYS